MSEKQTLLNKRALSIKEAAEYIGVSCGIIYHWLNKDILPYEEFPGTGKMKRKFRLIRKSEIDKFLEKNHHKPSTFVEKIIQKKKLSFSETILLPKK
jgi:excisionase family DNA binding protein